MSVKPAGWGKPGLAGAFGTPLGSVTAISCSGAGVDGEAGSVAVPATGGADGVAPAIGEASEADCAAAVSAGFAAFESGLAGSVSAASPATTRASARNK